jgi:hypothetical protein
MTLFLVFQIISEPEALEGGRCWIESNGNKYFGDGGLNITKVLFVPSFQGSFDCFQVFVQDSVMMTELDWSEEVTGR